MSSPGHAPPSLADAPPSPPDGDSPQHRTLAPPRVKSTHHDSDNQKFGDCHAPDAVVLLSDDSEPEMDWKEQVDEAFYLMSEVLVSFVGFLHHVLCRPFALAASSARRSVASDRCDRCLWGALAITMTRLCPDSLSRRRLLFFYSLGFLIGSFIYVSLLNLSYAMHYNGHTMKVHQVALSMPETPLYQTTLLRQLVTTTRPASLGDQGVATMRVAPSGVDRERPLVMAGNWTGGFSDDGRARVRELLGADGWTVAGGQGPRAISKIIHQSWKIRYVPEQFTHPIKSWWKNHPQWRHLFWTSNGGSHLVHREFQRYEDVYKNYTAELHRFTVNRFFILYHYGGVFADIDLESLKPLDLLLERYSCVLTEQPLVHRAVLFNLTAPNYVVNSFMACSPRHPFLGFVLEMLETYQPYDSIIEPEMERVEKSVGALFLGDVLELYKIAFNRTVAEHVHVLPSDWLMPNWNPQYRSPLVMRCLSQVVLTEKGKAVCNRLMNTDFSDAIPAKAYIRSHWVDLYDENVRMKLAKEESIAVNELDKGKGEKREVK